MDQGGETGSIKDWVLKEMVSKKEEDQSVIGRILMENREKSKELATIREDGRVTIQRINDTTTNQILSYLLGAAYAKIAELRDDDGVSISELVNELRLNENTVGVSIKRLTDSGLILRKQEGVYRVEYRKIPDIVGRMIGHAPSRDPGVRRPKTMDVFKLYADLKADGLRRYLLTLKTPVLKNIIKEKRLDPSGNSLKISDRVRLIDLIVSRVESRLRHGDVFMDEHTNGESFAKDRSNDDSAFANSG